MNVPKVLECALICVVAASPARAQQPVPGNARVRNPALRQELLDMRREDQAVRVATLQSLKRQGINVGDSSQFKDEKIKQIVEAENKKTRHVDEKNIRRLKQIIVEHGWPGNSLVGSSGADAAWIIIQHADEDMALQRKCLQLMEAAPAGEVEPKNVAYLTDRVLVNEGKPQRYGAQLGENFTPRPIEDPANVDERRAKVDLPPLAEYIKFARESYEKLASGETSSDEAGR
jgi:hypothetical protein